jgi:hypothetical protein
VTLLKRFDYTRLSIIAKLTTALGADGARLLVGGFSDGPAYSGRSALYFLLYVGTLYCGKDQGDISDLQKFTFVFVIPRRYALQGKSSLISSSWPFLLSLALSRRKLATFPPCQLPQVLGKCSVAPAAAPPHPAPRSPKYLIVAAVVSLILTLSIKV